MVNKKIILASGSPRRKELLSQIGLKFKCMPSKYEEDMTLKLSPSRLVKKLSHGKAKEVADRLNSGLVIGSDTFLTFRGKKLGKPKSKKEAKEILKKLSGNTVKIYSGITIIDSKTKKELVDYEVSKLKFKKLTEKEIENYIKTKEPLDKAGSIAIQGKGAVFIKEVRGCYSNIIGLPLGKLSEMLKKFNVKIF